MEGARHLDLECPLTSEQRRTLTPLLSRTARARRIRNDRMIVLCSPCSALRSVIRCLLGADSCMPPCPQVCVAGSLEEQDLADTGRTGLRPVELGPNSIGVGPGLGQIRPKSAFRIPQDLADRRWKELHRFRPSSDRSRSNLGRPRRRSDTQQHAKIKSVHDHEANIWPHPGRQDPRIPPNLAKYTWGFSKWILAEGGQISLVAIRRLKRVASCNACRVCVKPSPSERAREPLLGTIPSRAGFDEQFGRC